MPGEPFRFEALLSNISARLIATPPDRIGPEIRGSLEQVREHFGVDRCSLLHLLPGKTAFRIIFISDVAGSPPPVGTDLPVSIVPWSTMRLADRRETVCFTNLDELPEAASVCSKLGTQCTEEKEK